MRSSYIVCVLVVISMLSAVSSFAATSARLYVSATVLPFVSFNAVQHVTTYRVSSDDIKRGYVDLPNSMTVNVRTNLDAGVPVTVENAEKERVLVRESGTSAYIGNSFMVNTNAHLPNTRISKNLDLRIILSADESEGIHAISVSMTPSI